LQQSAIDAGYNVRVIDSDAIAVSFDETTTVADVVALSTALLGDRKVTETQIADKLEQVIAQGQSAYLPDSMQRTDSYLSQPCFNAYQSETSMMRYLRMLADRDIALDRAMIPLGSCTMKLNSATEMAPVSWPAFANMHPFTPTAQTAGYTQMIQELEAMLCACTGYAAVSLQPNAGSQGEFAGLLAISRYHASRNELHRNICLIPESAHGTNPASAQMAGMQVVVVGL